MQLFNVISEAVDKPNRKKKGFRGVKRRNKIIYILVTIIVKLENPRKSTEKLQQIVRKFFK